MRSTKSMNMTGSLSIGSNFNAVPYPSTSSYELDHSYEEVKPYLISHSKASTVIGIIVLALSYATLFLIGLSS